MNLWLKLGWREIVRNPRFTLLFVTNLALGLAGFLLIGAFGGSLASHLDDNLREMLGADLVLRSSRPLTSEEQTIASGLAGPGALHAEQLAFYSMVRGPRIARLARVVAVDEDHPLYGTLAYADGLVHAQVIAALQSERTVLLTREAARSLEVAAGETLTIGQADYRVAFFLERDPAAEFTAIDLAPKLFLGLSQVQGSGLIRFGSRVSYRTLIRLPPGTDATGVGARLEAALAAAAADGETPVGVTTTAEVNRRLGQLIGYFAEFLGLAGMVSLFLAGMAAAHLFSEQLHARRKETAILLALGARRAAALGLQTGVLATLGLAAALLAILFAWLLLPVFALLFGGLLPTGLQLGIGSADAAMALGVGVAGSFLFCLPVSVRLAAVQPLHLLQEVAEDPPEQPTALRLRLVLSLLPALGLLFLLASRLGGSLLVGAVFTGALVVLLSCLFLFARLLLVGCRGLAARASLTLRIVLRNLYRNRLAAASLFTALAAALLLVVLIPQAERGLQAEVSRPEGMELPDLFLVDIQTEQRQALVDFFRDGGPQLSALAPMVQGRIVQINGVSFADWRQRHADSEDRFFQRTEFNFSSRDQLDPSEALVRGRPLRSEAWTGQGPFEISMEQQFSQRLGVGIGDRLVFDIQGIELEGEVVNLRRVRWNSFQPNFFLLFQRGVLDEAPRTYLTSVSQVNAAQKHDLTRRLSGAFPNLSVIDVSRVVEQLDEIADRLAGALRFMAGLAMVTGLVAVFAIARQEALRREREINLLRVLGASIGRVRLLTMLEFGLVGAMAGLTAVLLSYAASLAVAWLLFDRLWRFDWLSALLLFAGATLACAGTALFAADSALHRRPVALLG
ncbi:MAG: hypothetical protein RBT36_08710 [Desulfobulbus sp.]|nr:hypothetical protein [Desulfobulbus sp.]